MDKAINERFALSQLQLFNFGVFNGEHVVDFQTPSSGDDSLGSISLVCGSSGSGKSTILDAVSILQGQSSAYLNSAAKNSASGRGKRTPSSYALGQLGEFPDENNIPRTRYLRREVDEPVFSALRATYTGAYGSKVSTACFTYVKQGTITCDKTIWMISPEEIDLKLAFAHPKPDFAIQTLKKLYPAASLTDTKKEYREKLLALLGVNEQFANLADKMKSADLHGGVEQVFTKMALGEPATLTHAAHIADLAGSLKTAREENNTKIWAIETQSTLIGYQDQYLKLLDTDEGLREWLGEHGPSAAAVEGFERWWDGAMLAAAERKKTALSADLPTAESALSDAQREEKSLTAELETVRRAYDEAGGAELARLDERIEAAAATVAATKKRHDSIEGDFANAQIAIPACEAEWNEARATLASAEQERKDKLTAWSRESLDLELARRVKQAEAEKAEEQLDLARRGQRISPTMAAAKQKVAEALDLNPRRIPYIAELFDLDPAAAQWRKAMRAALEPEARTLLIPAAIQETRRKLESALPSLPNGTKYRIIDPDAVPARDSSDVATERALLSHMRVDESSPFADFAKQWLKEQCSDLTMLAEGEGPDPISAITEGGHVMRRGEGRLSHQPGPDGDFIGFVDEKHIAACEARTSTLRKELDSLDRRITELEKENARIRAEQALLENVFGRFTFDDIAYERHALVLANLRSQKEELANSPLADLQLKMKTLENAKRRATTTTDNAASRVANLQKSIGRINGLIAASREKLSEPGRDPYEDEVRLFSANIGGRSIDDPADETKAAENKAAIFKDVLKASESKRREHLHLAERVEEYQKLMKDRLPNIIGSSAGTGVESMAYYRELPLTDGSPTLGQKMIALCDELSAFLLERKQYEDDVKEKFDKINETLSSHPFDRAGNELIVEPHFDKGRDRIREWKRAAGDLLSRFHGGSSMEEWKALNDAERTALEALAIRCGEALSAPIERQNGNVLSDPRLSLTIKAKAGEVIYRSTAGMNGGHSQELTAFVLGAAIYSAIPQTPDGCPCFGTLVLDEGFGAADSELTARALSALENFGLQIIIAAIEEKTSSISKLAADIHLVIRPNEHGPAWIAAGGHELTGDENA